MSRWLIVGRSADVEDARIDSWLGAVTALPTSADGVRSVAARPLPDSRGPADLVWDLTLPDGAAPHDIPAVSELLQQAPVRAELDVVPLQVVASRPDPFSGPRIKRALQIRVRKGVGAAELATFEGSLCGMPPRIPAIRGWALSRTDPAVAGGFTHCWEQEFAEEGQFRPYMAHSYHWTGVERWFDPEIPGCIVEELAHYIYPVPGPVLPEDAG